MTIDPSSRTPSERRLLVLVTLAGLVVAAVLIVLAVALGIDGSLMTHRP